MRMMGATIRGGLVGITILMPCLLLPGDGRQPIELIALLAVLLAVLVLTEYLSEVPSLIEFREAPPVNRMRFGALFLMVGLLCILARNIYAPTNLTALVALMAHVFGAFADAELSPVRLMGLIAPRDASEQMQVFLRNGAAVAYLLGVVTIGAFVLVVRLANWPLRSGPFNVWVNLPLFDPALGDDVVQRLRREAQISIGLGITLPFLLPVVARLVIDIMGLSYSIHPQGLIWIICAWAFFPANIAMRGVAMLRVAELIERQRRSQAVKAAVTDPIAEDFQPA